MGDSPMNERVKFIADGLQDDEPFSELCARAQISRKTGYKWVSDTRLLGVTGLVDRSRAPLSRPHICFGANRCHGWPCGYSPRHPSGADRPRSARSERPPRMEHNHERPHEALAYATPPRSNTRRFVPIPDNSRTRNTRPTSPSRRGPGWPWKLPPPQPAPPEGRPSGLDGWAVSASQVGQFFLSPDRAERQRLRPASIVLGGASHSPSPGLVSG